MKIVVYFKTETFGQIMHFVFMFDHSFGTITTRTNIIVLNIDALHAQPLFNEAHYKKKMFDNIYG